MAVFERLKQRQAALDAADRQRLFETAAFNDAARRRTPEDQLAAGYRQPFSVDADRILHSRAYTRYIDKTQVFYLIENDHVTHRVLHVQLVAKIARTVGRYLGLNEDLIEAVALGHDIGHAPFGHDGEAILSALCQQHGIGRFHHNLQSVVFLEKVERKGRGWNLCLQTLDGILCHDGEIHNQRLIPQAHRTFADLDAAQQRKKYSADDVLLVPMTLEGCVMRMADTVAYIGRDIEDAIRLGMIQRDDLPAACTRVLGHTNGAIVHTLVTDIIHNSLQQPWAAFSPEVSEALRQLKQFNLERIYLNPAIKRHTRTIQILFETLFESYLADLAAGNQNSNIFSGFLRDMHPDYLADNAPAEIVRDFVAGMTDRYFLRQCRLHNDLHNLVASMLNGNG